MSRTGQNLHPGRGISPKLVHCCGPHPASYATSTSGSCPGGKGPGSEDILVLRLTPSWYGQIKLYCLPKRRHAPEVSSSHVHHPKISNLTRIISSAFRGTPSALFCSVLRRSDFEQSHLEANTSRDKLGGFHSESFVWECVGGWNREERGNPGYWKSPQEVRLRQEN
jgi:hypothetical protein